MQQRAEPAKERTSLAIEPATALTFAVELAKAELAVVAVVAAVAKSAPQEAVAALAGAVALRVAPVLKCPPSSALPRVVRLDQCFAAVQPSLDNSR